MSGKVPYFCNWPDCDTPAVEQMHSSPAPLCRTHLLRLPADVRAEALNGRPEYEAMLDEVMDALGLLCKHKQHQGKCDNCRWDAATGVATSSRFL